MHGRGLSRVGPLLPFVMTVALATMLGLPGSVNAQSIPPNHNASATGQTVRQRQPAGSRLS